MTTVTRAEQSQTPAWKVGRLDWATVLVAVLIGGVLLAPVLTLIVHGLTPTGFAEESVGRRYFYTLRILYGDHERPWAPQGQLASVAHLGIQLILTLAGYPPTQLFPRIDLFAYAASILTVLLTTVAFAWAIRPIGSVIAKVLIAVILLFTVFDPATTRGYHLVAADYYPWVHTIAMIGVGALLRVVRARTPLTLRSGAWLGALAAAAISLKPTYLSFVMPIAFLLLVYGINRKAWASICRGVLAALAVTVIGTSAVFFMYYGGDAWAVASHVSSLVGFVDAIANPVSLADWLGMGLSRWRQGETLPFSIALVPVLVLSAVLLPNRAVSIGLLLGAVANVYVAWRRFHPNTLIETNDYTFLAVVVWAAVVFVPALRALIGSLAAQFPRASWVWFASLPLAGAVLAYVIGAQAAEQIEGGRADVLRSFGRGTAGANALTTHLQSRPGKVAFLIPGNAYRPLTVDSAIYKGGMNELNPVWGDSPLVSGMFPARYYFVDRLLPATDPDMSEFSRIVFVRLPGERLEGEVAKRLRDTFEVWLGLYACDFRVDLVQQEIIVCERSVESLAATGGQRATFMQAKGDPTPELVANYRRVHASSEGIIATQQDMGRDLDLWHLRSDDSVASIVGPDGAKVWIDGVGTWDPVTRTLSGLGATFVGGQPRIDVGGLAASNTNPRLDRPGSRRQPIFGWQLEPRDDPPAVERLSDEAGQFIRVRPAAEGTAVTLYSRAPLSKLDDTPITVRAVVRAHGNRAATLTIDDVTSSDGSSVTRSVSTRSTDTWETLSVWLSRATFPADRDRFSVRIVDADEGDWVDVREISVFEGIVP